MCRHVCADQRGNHIFAFDTLELENEKCVGIQRIRCSPFTFDKWYGTNPRQYVALIQPSNHSKIKFADFDITIKEHRDKIWFGDDGWGAFVVRAQNSVDYRCARKPYPWQGAFDEDLVASQQQRQG